MGRQMSNRVVFWDFDGTLAYRSGGWRGTIAEVLADHEPQLQATPEDVRPHIQSGFPWDNPEVPHPHLSDAERWWKALRPMLATAMAGLGVNTERAWELALLVRAYYLRRSAWALYEDTLPVLRELAGLGWRQLVLSNHVPELPHIADYLGVVPLVERVINSAQVGYEKPHSEIYRQALSYVGQAEMVWMVGDNYACDVVGAQAAGMKALLVRRSHPEAAEFLPDLRAAAAALIASAAGQSRP